MGIRYKPKTQDPLKPNLVQNIPAELENRLGSEFYFPMELRDSKWRMAKGVERINQAIAITLKTPIGRHFNQPDFGSLLPWMIFEQYDKSFIREIDVYVRQALKIWVPNITVLRADIDPKDIANGMVHVIVVYRINGTNGEERVKVSLRHDDQIKQDPSIFTIGGIPVF